MKRSGFTLIEILLSIILISILVMISIPINQSFQNKNNLDITRDTIIQILRQAQTYAYTGKEDSNWGIYSDNITKTITLFKGFSYSGRDLAFDETTPLPKNTNIYFSSGENSKDYIVFSKLTGLPQSNIQITLSGTNNQTKIISINEKGIISY